MANLPNCPKCGDEYTYEDGHMFICPMCGNEWTAADAQAAAEAGIIRDANGNELADGDTVVVVKDLKVKVAGGCWLRLGRRTWPAVIDMA